MSALRTLLLAVLFALGTVLLGWWAVPAVAAVWGILERRTPRPGLTAAAAGAAAWGGYLAIMGLGGASVLDFGARLALSMQLPVWAPLTATLLLPALLGGTTASLAASFANAAGP
jgi:hypothetical protein